MYDTQLLGSDANGLKMRIDACADHVYFWIPIDDPWCGKLLQVWDELWYCVLLPLVSSSSHLGQNGWWTAGQGGILALHRKHRRYTTSCQLLGMDWVWVLGLPWSYWKCQLYLRGQTFTWWDIAGLTWSYIECFSETRCIWISAVGYCIYIYKHMIIYTIQ